MTHPNHLVAQYQETVRLFEEDFQPLFYQGFRRMGESLKSFLLSRQLAVWQEEVKVLEGRKKEYCKEDVANEINKPYDWHGYAHALEDVLIPLRSAIEWAKGEIKI